MLAAPGSRTPEVSGLDSQDAGQGVSQEVRCGGFGKCQVHLFSLYMGRYWVHTKEGSSSSLTRAGTLETMTGLLEHNYSVSHARFAFHLRTNLGRWCYQIHLTDEGSETQVVEPGFGSKCFCVIPWASFNVKIFCVCSGALFLPCLRLSVWW